MSETEYLAFIDPIKHKIFRLSKRFLVSVDEAEDATQDVLLKLWKNRKRLSTISNPEAFAMTMTKNHCFDRLKSRQASNLKIIHSNFTGYESLEMRIENNDSINLINKLINLLPEKQRLVIQLRDIECYEFKEISEIIGMNETAIRVTLSRARKKLRNELIKLHNYGTQ